MFPPICCVFDAISRLRSREKLELGVRESCRSIQSESAPSKASSTVSCELLEAKLSGAVCCQGILLAAIISFGSNGTCLAESRQNTEPAPPSSTAGTPISPRIEQKADGSGAAAQANTKILGFRSALFGADEADVRAAAKKDFGVTDAGFSKSQNLADRTEVDSVKVPDILPGGGSAEVGYIFGYKSKKLTQVNVIWSKATDRSLTPDRLVANGEALKSYFASEGFVASSIATDTMLHDGILLFRGTDVDGHTVALMLRGSMSAATDKAPQRFTPIALLLFYIADPKTPDVFKIPAGKF